MMWTIMNASARKRVGGGGGGGFSCVYAMNGDATVVGQEQMVVTGADYQTVAYTTVPPGIAHSAAAIPAGEFPVLETFPISSGKVQIGLTNILLPISDMVSSFTAYLTRFNIADSTFTTQISLDFTTYFGTPNNLARVNITDNTGSFLQIDNLAASPTSAWMVFDTVAGTFRVWLDFGAGPVEQVLEFNAFTPDAACIISCVGYQSSSMPAEDVGKTVGYTITTSASEMPVLVEGAIDICGNLIA